MEEKLLAKGFFIKIDKCENTYVFQLWYTRKQPMGFSKPYHSYKECLQGVISFKNYLKNDKPSEDNGLARIVKKDANNYAYEFYDYAGRVLYTSRAIEAKQNCKKSMISTCKNFPYTEIR